MLKPISITVLVALTTLGTPGARGDEGSSPPRAPRIPKDGRLTRVAAARIAAARNYGYLVEKLEKQRRGHLVEAAHREFTPALTIDAHFDNDRVPAPTEEMPNPTERERSADYGGTVRWTSPIGTKVSVGTSADQRLTGANDHAADVTLSLTQLLLKDGWGACAATPLRRAEVDARRQSEVLRARLNDLLVDVERAYGELAFAQADLEIKKRSMELAKSQFEDTRENIRRGILAEAEIYVVEENLVRFERQLIQARERLDVARRNMAGLLAADPETPLVAAEPLGWRETPVPHSTSAVRQALSDNPDLRSRELDLERARVDFEFESNQRLPSLDLEASMGFNGGDEDTLRSAYDEAGQRRRAESRVGLVFEILLDADPDRAKVAAAKTELEKQALNLRDRRAELSVEVGNLVTELGSLYERLQRAVRLEELGELKLAAEEEKYRNGASTLTEVVRFQRDLDDAQIDVRRNQQQLWNTRARFLRATGDLHRQSGIEVN